MSLTRADRWLAVVVTILVALGLYWMWGAPKVHSTRSAAATADPANRKLGREWVAATSHYQVTTRATMEQTTEFGAAAEALYRAYAGYFAIDDKAVPKGGLRMRLHKDVEQFRAAGGDPQQAKALYRPPFVHAYVDRTDPRIVHWQLLAATLQLNNEVLRLPRGGWLDHGLAYYFSASNFDDWTLTPGTVELRAYPANELAKLQLSADARADLAAGNELVPLRELVAGGKGSASPSARAVASWSLVHFLIHGDGGSRAAKFREFIAGGGAAADFERRFGPFEVVEREWYGYMRGLGGVAGAPQKVIVVD